MAFNVLADGGAVVPYWVVEAGANYAGISIRGGCFCNPGVSELAFNIGDDEARECLATFAPGEFTPERFSECLRGKPVGAVRASLGMGSNESDVDRFLEFLAGYEN